jgi:hypothetical protein
MHFAGMNYLAILVAAVAAWLAGAAWYMTLSNQWMAAAGLTKERIEARQKGAGGFLPFIYAFVADLVMAWVLAGIIGHLGSGQVTFANGVISGALCWLGFVITTMLVNNAYAFRDKRLLLIDGGYWLVVLILMGAIIGGWGI